MALLSEKFTEIKDLQKSNPQLFLDKIIEALNPDAKFAEDELKTLEEIILTLGNFYARSNQGEKILEFVKNGRNIFNNFSKAKSTKIIRDLVDCLDLCPNSEALQVDLCNYLLTWCREEKRVYLIPKIEIKLANVYMNKSKYSSALEITDRIINEARKKDDKHLMVETQLIEAKVYHRLENLAKAKASLTASRAGANSIYCPPLLQADIDLTAGVINAQEKDYKTAYSYFYEAFESFHNLENPQAIVCLKYMLLTKIMTNSVDEVNSLLNGKFGLKYEGKDLDAMKAIADAHKNKSLGDFKEALTLYTHELSDDPIIASHITNLYEKLLEENLLTIIAPYSRIQISRISLKIGLEEGLMLRKLSEMILDKKIEGTLDQGSGYLIVFEEIKCDNLYSYAQEAIEQLDLAVDKLFEKAKKIQE